MKILVATALAVTMGATDIANANPFTNGSFETHNLSTSYYGYQYSSFNSYPGQYLGTAELSAPGWSFSDASGLSRNNTAWGGTASDGNVFAFLQSSDEYSFGSGSISQTFSGVAGNYFFSFDMEQRSTWRIGAVQTVSVFLDGNTGWSGTPSDTWSTFSFSAFNVAAGKHTLSFAATNLNGARDTSVFLDKVQLAVSAVPEPETYAMFLAGLGVVGAIARRRKQTRINARQRVRLAW